MFSNERNNQMSKIAVIDIGSNSIRLVIYSSLTRILIPIFNEKTLCGLAKGINKNQCLDKEAVALATNVLDRFICLVKTAKIKNVFLLATAAIRDSIDGKEFVNRIEKKHKVNIQILSGQEEAEYSSLGIISSIDNPEGLVGDLGGGSLELSRVESNKILTAKSYSIGVLRLVEHKRELKKIREKVEKDIKQFPQIKEVQKQNFYAIGGGFRSLAKLYIEITGYPLKIIHNLTIQSKDIIDFLEDIINTEIPKLKKYNKSLPSSRVETIWYAAIILERIIKLFKPVNIVFSAYGVREGYVFSKLSIDEQKQDSLLAGCHNLNNLLSQSTEYSYALFNWVSKLFPKETEQDKRLMLAACIVSDIACFEHIEYKAEIAYKKFIDSYVTGIDHFTRLFIATVLFFRYKSNDEAKLLNLSKQFLEKEEFRKALILGYAMRLAYELSAGEMEVLKSTAICLNKDKIVLTIPNGYEALISEPIEKRLKKLAKKLGVKPIYEIV
jgi:exopolyphosphatase/guanosine-5'-triphosphate,3'-diphosphate pyrophosphatase